MTDARLSGIMAGKHGSLDSYGFLFPGQGSQKRGMGREFYEANETARSVFDKAEKTLSDCSVKALCFEADDEELTKTENAQPALFAVSFAVYQALRGMGYEGAVFAGHSLGEYTAVAAAGYLSFEDGLGLVRRRGILMRDCDPERKGGMAAIIGLDAGAIGKICEETGGVYPANFNSPNQVVISGLKEKVREAAGRCAASGAKRTVVLNVGGAFHTAYLAEAAREMEKELGRVEWREGRGKVASNATGTVTEDPALIRRNLVAQLVSPVLWTDSIRALVGMGHARFVEAGPGGVLKGLARSISREVQVVSVEKPGDLGGLS
jgi:[acyl-carrier-protein] S-malonyltransferase